MDLKLWGRKGCVSVVSCTTAAEMAGTCVNWDKCVSPAGKGKGQLSLSVTIY